MDLDKYLQQAGMASPPPTPVVPGMKMEFPGPPPGYGHGFGPPVILDLSPRNVVDQSLPYSPVTVDGEGCEVVRIKREVKTESPDSAPGDDYDDDGVLEEEEEGCSRTMARMPEASLLKWHQRQKRRQEEEVVTPPPAAVAADDAVRKTLVQRKVSSPASSAIPVGIAVARQRKDKCRSDTPMPVQPKARHPVLQQSSYSSPSESCMSDPSAGSTEFNSPSGYPSGRAAVYNPAALYAAGQSAASWAWSNPADYNSLWHHSTTADSIMSYPNYPPTPPASSTTSLLHHHHHHPASGLTPSPFLLIPASCLDPYQRAAAMLWPGYAAPAQSPWGLPPDMTSAPAASWSIPARSAFELPLLRADVTAYEDQIVVTKPECNDESPIMTEIKEERISPQPPNDVSDQKESSQPNTVPDNLADGWISPAADYSGLQLLSDSIERFVSADHAKSSHQSEAATTSPQPYDNRAEVAGNALDVLCAAALYQQSNAEPKEMTSPRPTAAGFQNLEFDVRCKLAELQRKYKEKQKELSSLKCKKNKSDKKKKKRRSSTDKEEKAASRRRNSSTGSSSRDGNTAVATKQQAEQSSETSKIVSTPVDFIIPGRLELPSSTQRLTGDDVKVELSKIPSSYAAALASAATTVAATPATPTTTTTTVEVKKKRKPDFPVKKQDTELTETIVPSKKRKFLQLFQWCHDIKKSKKKSSSSTSSSSSKKTPSVKPKIKPKLRAELQVKQASSESSAESDNEDEPEEVEEPEENDVEEIETDRLEKHCLPALQYLQLSDDSGAEIDTVLPVAPSPIPPASSPPPPVKSPEPVMDPVPPVVDPEPPKSSDPEPEDSNSVEQKSPWILTQDLLRDGLRVLVSEEGLFHGGSVSAICPPDIYGVIVDGERGGRPRIMSTEELLHEALLEVHPVDLSQLPVGTRVCAYWSRKSRCLYPGVVSNIHPATPATGHRQVAREDEIDVEFDDGDSGRFPVSQIRLLPPDYPVLERDPNPLLTLESRRHKRRISEPTGVPPLIPAVKSSVRPAESADEPSTKKTKKVKGDETKENNVSPSKKKASKKKKAADEDLVIPVSPGLAADVAPSDDEPVVKMETRGNNKEAVNYSASPSPRRAAVQKTRSPEQRQRKKSATVVPERQLWEWLGGSFKKASKGKGRKEFYKAIHRGDEVIRVGDCAVFLSTGRTDRPYVGRIELLWQSWGGAMTVKVRWFYHPEETCGGRRLTQLKIAGALFESNHADENDVQTISHCCTVSSLEEYRLMCRGKPDVNLNLDANNGSGYDQFYLAGFYDPTSGHLSFEPGVLDHQQ